MGKFNLSGTEMEIMKLLWNMDKKMTFREILDYFNMYHGKNWQRQTLRTQLLRLTEKGFISSEKDNGLLVYFPLITEEENVRIWSRTFLNVVFEGSVKKFIQALYGDAKLDQETIDELREFIDE